MGIIIASPDGLTQETGHPGHPSIFLAGGISDCADWQEQAALYIAAATDATVFNPRRVVFDMRADSEEARVQIRWEHRALRQCAFNLFWFPKETLCPITLLELGSAIERLGYEELLVGTHPDYKRRFDVIEQLELGGHHGIVYDDLTALLHEAVRRLNAEQTHLTSPS